MYFFHPSFKDRLRQMNPVTAKKGEIDRPLFWKVYIDIWKDHPILGTGPNSSKYIRKEYYKKYVDEDYKKMFDAHNNYLQFMAESGLIGLFSFLAIFVAYFYQLRFIFKKYYKSLKQITRNRQKLWLDNPYDAMSILSLLMIITMLLGSFTQNAFKDSEVIIFFWIIFALSATNKEVNSI